MILSLRIHFVPASRTLLACVALAFGAGSASAASDKPDEDGSHTAWKLTTGLYQINGGGQPRASALDLNLRASGDFGNAWLGRYQETAGGPRQWRAGWDRFFDAGSVQVQPSLQVASGGFVGGSLYAEAGETWFAGIGAGRTNLRPYVNLNFDPNDMVMLAAGRRTEGRQVQVLLVADNREHPEQRHLHLNWKQERSGGEKLTMDVLAKTGDVDGEHIRRLGASLTYDWRHWSLRAAWDPKVNFTPQNMLRVSVAARF